MEIGLRIELLECVDPISAWTCYGYGWIPKDSFKKGKQEPHLFFSKYGYCSWNAKINTSDYFFNKAYKKIGCFVITKLK